MLNSPSQIPDAAKPPVYRFKNEVSRSRPYNRASICTLFQGANTPDEVTGLLLTANQRLTGASEDTRRKWHEAAERRLAQLRGSGIVGQASSLPLPSEAHAV
jgi:hypothetical protein